MSLLEQEDFSQASFLLSVLGEGPSSSTLPSSSVSHLIR